MALKQEAETSSKKLNLGCGQFPKPGYLNVDLNPLAKADLFHDLRSLPYPFATGSFDLIEAEHVLEHLGEPFLVMKELHRILKPGGRLLIWVPHFSRGFTHSEHKSGFDVSFPLYFNPNFPGGYTGVEFLSRRTRLRWFCQPYFKKLVLPKIQYWIGLGLGAFFDFFAALSPLACSRIWCFWVGGFEEVEFVLEKPRS